MQREKKESIASLLAKAAKVTIDERGRLYLPKMVRKQIAARTDEPLFVVVYDDCLIIYTLKGLTNHKQS